MGEATLLRCNYVLVLLHLLARRTLSESERSVGVRDDGTPDQRPF